MRLAALERRARGARRRAATSRRRCGPTCAAAPAGSPSSRPRADALGRRRHARRAARAARDPLLAAWRARGRRAGLPDLGARRGPRRRRVRRRRRAGRTRSSSSGPTRRSPRAPAARAGGGRVQGRNSTVPLSHPVERARRASGRSRCRRPGSSLPTSSRTPVGAGPGGARPRRSPTAVPSAASATARCRRAPARSADETGEAVRVLVAPRGRGAPWAQAPAARPSACAPTAPASSASGAPRVRPTWRRWWRACASSAPGVRGRAGRGGRPTRGSRPARRRLGRGARCRCTR